MHRYILLLISLTAVTPGSLHAGTFDRSPLAPELGVDGLDRGVAQQHVGRDLFSNPYATVTVGNVDVYDVFPYVEARHFQIVSDPQWNRLVFGEVGRSLKAFDGQGTAFGALSNPRGMAVDEGHRIYVADAGNDRVLVMRATTEFADITLIPMFEIGGLHGPHDVAFSDGGTPFDTDDDVLYVADTGRNRIVAYTIDASGAREVASIGELGSGMGRFAGPLAVTVGRAEGVSTRDVFVADAHTRRIVHLRHTGSGFEWVSERTHDADVVTSLDTDHWGNLYAAAPNRGVVRKFGPDMTPVADLEGTARPRSFHVPFLNVRDHRNGRIEHVGQRSGVLLEQWSPASGMKLWNLGVEISDLVMTEGETPAARFTITDHARVKLEITDMATGRLLVHRTTEPYAAGAHALALTKDDLDRAAGAGEVMLRLSALSSYADGPTAMAQTVFTLNGEGIALPARPVLLGNSPNPFRPSTRISFMLPADKTDAAKLRVFDTMGRLVRTFGGAWKPGRNEVVWDGTNESGAGVSAGIYFYRLEVDQEALSDKMVLVR